MRSRDAAILGTLIFGGVAACGPDRPSTPGCAALADLGRNYVPPRGYVCYGATSPIRVDGRLDEPAWRAVPWTEDFVDIEGPIKPRPRLRTRAKLLWDADYLYIGAELEEPHVCATVRHHDEVIFQDNDFEVFIDPAGEAQPYAEFEINALGTGWDLLLTRPYRDSGRPISSWEIPGLRSAVHVDGTLNNPSDTDRGWSIELAFPWKVLGELTDRPVPPRDGDQWRVNLSRVEWRYEILGSQYRKVPGTREDNWVWSPQGVVDMHRPQTWGYVQFSTSRPGSARFWPDPAGPTRHLLYALYERQHAYRKEHGRWARTLQDLGITEDASGSGVPIRIEVTSDLFEITSEAETPGKGRRQWHIRQDARTWHD